MPAWVLVIGLLSTPPQTQSAPAAVAPVDLSDAELLRPVAELIFRDVDGLIEKLRQKGVSWIMV